MSWPRQLPPHGGTFAISIAKRERIKPEERSAGIGDIPPAM